ncbi:hypothetical protein N7499_005532 [Penicillium canescens]|uniref:Crh-like protein n=1 Tax=Penicillium canescens TaxID=5083 RepID=A0AAD6IC31_PENCN|nr:uncharacterized protein N7446_001298 [Penicillium canescens]KAJ5998088.1 hypothetical protein N7522_009748 [Penicillium canescens]KAJ6043102.1 hypothetical protein N7460_004457 [Penicillium canescens]KAJ6054578.1 hypothetical protein N7444_003676 [Penicillium canescens]KAJ6073521.1 hypothetical protein N7446_001298 [Penicillium canescens]KAJ6080658.1 hypothetical protein N7499_005532 [Penicillium canescens]
MPSIMKLVAAALAVAPLAAAQTYSNCNPTKKTCPANPGSTESDLKFDFTQSSGLDKWTTTAGQVNTGSNGAEFTVNKKGDAPTIQTDFYFFYGEITVEMKSAPGQGIVSSIVLQSDDLDEVDWEGIGGNNGAIQTNYFGKGDTTTYDRDTWPAVATPQDTFHKYTVNWSKEALVWSVDGNVVRTLKYADAQGGSRFPQTPMNLRIGIWAGGDSGNGQGTIDWAGGLTDYSAAPFSMYIKSVEIKNANPAESYTWSDMSGSSDSIKFTGSNAVSARSTTTTAAPTSVTEASPAQTSSAEDSTTEASTTEASSTPTTMVTSTQSSSASSGVGSSTAASTGASSSGASSSGVSGSSSSAGATETGSGAGSGSSSSGSGSSGTSTQTGSGSSTSASASASSSPAFNAASNVAASYMGPVSILALVATFFQL